MIGNAIPPAITYYLFQSMKEVSLKKMILINEVRDYVHFAPKQPVPSTSPDTAKFKYRDTRSFRLAIPKFRFGSGVRFELANSFDNDNVKWGVNFFYGNSKEIRRIELNAAKLTAIQEVMYSEKVDIKKELLKVRELAETVESKKLQGVWTHKSNGHAHPYEILDNLSKLGEGISKKLKKINLDKEILEAITGRNLNKKLIEDQRTVLSGIIIGSVFNEHVK
jgi:DNA (cytosine-5)-methyltransferase 1